MGWRDRAEAGKTGVIWALAAAALAAQACAAGAAPTYYYYGFDLDAAALFGEDASTAVEGGVEAAPASSGSSSGAMDPSASGSSSAGGDDSSAPSGPTSGGSTGPDPGGASSGGADAGAGPCSASTCPMGCCDPTQGCLSFGLDTACGKGGAACQNCTMVGATCNNGSCVTPGGTGSSGMFATPACNPMKCQPNILTCWGPPCCKSDGTCGCRQLGLAPCM